MGIIEIIAIVVGGLVLVGGFVFAIYDSYLRKDNKQD